MGRQEKRRHERCRWIRHQAFKSSKNQERTTKTKEDNWWRWLRRLWYICWKGKNPKSQREIWPWRTKQTFQRLFQVQKQKELLLKSSGKERRCSWRWCQNQWKWRGLWGNSWPKNSLKLLKGHSWDHGYWFESLLNRSFMSLLRTVVRRRAFYRCLQTLTGNQQ